jgi:hypothetical protein
MIVESYFDRQVFPIGSNIDGNIHFGKIHVKSTKRVVILAETNAGALHNIAQGFQCFGNVGGDFSLSGTISLLFGII